MSGEQSVDWRDLPPLEPDERPELPDDWVPSQTFLRTHDECDRAAYLQLRYRGGAGSHEMNRGALFHEIVERLIRHLIEHGEPKATPEMGKEMLAEVQLERPELQVSAAERDALRYMVDHWCRGTYFDRPIIGIEQTLTLELGGFRVLARADLVEQAGAGVCEITDWKTSFPPESDAFQRQAYSETGEPRWAGNFQLNMLAVLAAFGVANDGMPLGQFERYRLTLAFPRRLLSDGRIATRTVEVTPPQLAGFREDLELQLLRLREVNLGGGKWQPTPGSQCQICPAEYGCPLPPLLRAESQLANAESVDDLERLAASWHFMTRRAADLKARIKKAALRLEDDDPDALTLPDGDRGIRIGSDLALLFLPDEREEIRDKAKLREAVDRAAKYGDRIDWAEHFKFSEGTRFEKRKVAPR